ncbi:hypothetical protein PT276_00520 [Orbaceae bacterium ESL0721]|nr:hypothetical protein [Orbaceae bacterium ESL0721]
MSHKYSAIDLPIKSIELKKPKYRLLTTYPNVQFPMPDPDLETE